jgi:hypothetical protein
MHHTPLYYVTWRVAFSIGIFPNASMMMHSCIKNTRLTFSDDNVLTILARTKVRI